LRLGPKAILRSDLPNANPDDEDQPADDGLVLIVRGDIETGEGSLIETNGNLVIADGMEYVPEKDGRLASEAVGLLAGQFDYPDVAPRGTPPLKFTASGPDAPRVAEIRPVAGLSGKNVAFTAKTDPDYPDTDSWSWDFGGGASPSTSSDASPSVTLGAPGAYVGSLTLTNGVETSTTEFVYLVFKGANITLPTAWNLCGNINLNPPAGVNPAAWIFARAGWAGCVRGGPGGGGGGPGPRPAFAWNFAGGKDRKAKTGKCGTVRGRRGGNAFSGLLWVAGNLVVKADWSIALGNGGRGGNATAACDVPGADATAIAGKGGRPGRVSMKAGFNLGIPADIDFSGGSLTILPGDGGDGGDAAASTVDGDDGCPAQAAGKATSIGGAGHPAFFGTFAGGGAVGGPPGAFGNRASGLMLWSLGAQKGMGNVTIVGTLSGGDGGDAAADSGNGGDGTDCGCAAGAGGAAKALGGDGGLAEFKTFSAAAGAIKRNSLLGGPLGDDTGGDGGDSDANAGDGGDGGACPKCAVKAGGAAGPGGNADSDSGKGGKGETDGTDGKSTGSPGDGGNGGDGCPPAGKGVAGSLTKMTGHANPQTSTGADGAPGVDTCCCPPPAPGCDDKDPCTDDNCDPATGNCEHPAKDCDDQDACTADSCNPETGVCEHAAKDCNDDILCTLDWCDQTGQCRHDCLPGKFCDDGDGNTTSDQCRIDGTACICKGDSGCTVDPDCDDGNACTQDSCSAGECVHDCLNGNTCDDGIPGTLDDQCGKGPDGGCICRGIPKCKTDADCDDGESCTTDSCDPTSGECKNECLLETPCDDGDAGTTDDKCLLDDFFGMQVCGCVGTKACKTDADCKDGEQCTYDWCDESGKCRNDCQKGLKCDDGNPMNTNDVCRWDSGSGCYCLGDEGCANDTDCDDTNPCTTDKCSGGECIHDCLPDAPCDDGDVDTVGDSCLLITQTDYEGCICEGELKCTGDADCEDLDFCTIDKCDVASGVCSNKPRDCSDGVPCTTDQCDSTTEQCIHTQDDQACDDDNACTNDKCDLELGCQHTNATGSCDDKDPCTVGDFCEAGFCIGGPPKNCEDQDKCTIDVCDPVTGDCSHEPKACDDSDKCTYDSCNPENGQCVYEQIACMAPDACTDAWCDKSTGDCKTAKKDCSDQFSCTLDGCDPGAAPGCTHDPIHILCDDSNDCTQDICSLAFGCVHENLTGPCDDQDPCTVGDFCEAGFCIGGPPNKCDDYDPCTVDSCDSVAGKCVHTPKDCDDGVACTIDSCLPDLDGACIHEPDMISCDDDNVCTIDTCDLSKGCQHTNTTGSCDDGNLCTVGDFCEAGFCMGGRPTNAKTVISAPLTRATPRPASVLMNPRIARTPACVPRTCATRSRESAITSKRPAMT
ncbi:MAG: PKD domain-containing protein, partial [Deltaproteobacteria bacterium]|nr:PKD domain-containing protein [Deltaproteobacteria bacterium]